MTSYYETQPTVETEWESSQSNGITTFTADAEQFGRWRIIGLTPLQPVAVRLRGGGESLYEVDVSALRPGEHRFVELRLDQAGKDLRVRVLSPEGAPLKKAQVQVVQESNDSSQFEGYGVRSQAPLRTIFRLARRVVRKEA